MCGMMGEYLIYFNDKLNVPYDLDDEIVANVIMTIYKELK